MRIAITGHRLKDVKEPETHARTKLAVKMRYAENVEEVIVGMCDGIDLWAADEARNLGYKVTAVVPYKGFRNRIETPELYDSVLEYASEVVVLNDAIEPPGPNCFHVRNRYMVDRADVLLAYCELGRQSGGTVATIKYAIEKDIPVANVINNAPY